MLRLTLTRLLLAIPTALGVSIICFLMVHLAPGDPVRSMLPPGAPPEDVAMLRAAYGLDQPLPVQFGLWLLRAASGDLGNSIQTQAPVLDEIGLALGNTLGVALVAALLAAAGGILLGAIAAYNHGRWIANAAVGVAVVGLSVSSFWLGIVLIIVFAVELGWLPATGIGQPSEGLFGLRYAVLPVATMVLTPLGILTRTVRAALLEVLGQDYILALRARGLLPAALLGHALRNAAPQIVAMAGIQFGYLLGGSILVETVFSWPGTGFLLNRAILTRDIPVLQGAVLLLAVIFVLINLAVDLVQASLDPRLRR